MGKWPEPSGSVRVRPRGVWAWSVWSLWGGVEGAEFGARENGISLCASTLYRVYIYRLRAYVDDGEDLRIYVCLRTRLY